MHPSLYISLSLSFFFSPFFFFNLLAFGHKIPPFSLVEKHAPSIKFDSLHLYRAPAEEAIQRLQGTMIGQQVVRLSWGRSPTTKQVVQSLC